MEVPWKICIFWMIFTIATMSHGQVQELTRHWNNLNDSIQRCFPKDSKNDTQDDTQKSLIKKHFQKKYQRDMNVLHCGGKLNFSLESPLVPLVQIQQELQIQLLDQHHIKERMVDLLNNAILFKRQFSPSEFQDPNQFESDLKMAIKELCFVNSPTNYCWKNGKDLAPSILSLLTQKYTDYRPENRQAFFHRYPKTSSDDTILEKINGSVEQLNGELSKIQIPKNLHSKKDSQTHLTKYQSLYEEILLSPVGIFFLGQDVQSNIGEKKSIEKSLVTHRSPSVSYNGLSSHSKLQSTSPIEKSRQEIKKAFSQRAKNLLVPMKSFGGGTNHKAHLKKQMVEDPIGTLESFYTSPESIALLCPLLDEIDNDRTFKDELYQGLNSASMAISGALVVTGIGAPLLSGGALLTRVGLSSARSLWGINSAMLLEQSISGIKTYQDLNDQRAMGFSTNNPESLTIVGQKSQALNEKIADDLEGMLMYTGGAALGLGLEKIIVLNPKFFEKLTSNSFNSAANISAKAKSQVTETISQLNQNPQFRKFVEKVALGNKTLKEQFRQFIEQFSTTSPKLKEKFFFWLRSPQATPEKIQSVIKDSVKNTTSCLAPTNPIPGK